MGLDSGGTINAQDVWEWNTQTNSWSSLPNFGGTGRQNSVSFTIGNKGYIGTGYDNTSTFDFWQYSDTTLLINELSNEIFVAFPNPAQDFITVRVFQSDAAKNFIYEIYNALGDKTIDGILKLNNRIDLFDIPNGIYYLRVYNNLKDYKVIFVKG